MNQVAKLNHEILKDNEHNKFLIFISILVGWIFLVTYTGIGNSSIVILSILVSSLLWFKFNKFKILNNKRFINNFSEIGKILKKNEVLVQKSVRLESLYQENKVLIQKNAELEKSIFKQREELIQKNAELEKDIFKQSEEIIQIKTELDNIRQKNIELNRKKVNFQTRATDNQKCILFLLYKKLSAQYKIVSRKEFFHYINKGLKEEKCPIQLKSIHFIENLCNKNLEFEFSVKGDDNSENDS